MWHVGLFHIWVLETKLFLSALGQVFLHIVDDACLCTGCQDRNRVVCVFCRSHAGFVSTPEALECLGKFRAGWNALGAGFLLWQRLSFVGNDSLPWGLKAANRKQGRYTAKKKRVQAVLKIAEFCYLLNINCAYFLVANITLYLERDWGRDLDMHWSHSIMLMCYITHPLAQSAVHQCLRIHLHEFPYIQWMGSSQGWEIFVMLLEMKMEFPTHFPEMCFLSALPYT